MAETQTEKSRSYEVLVGAVVLRTGPGKSDVYRVTRGKRVTGKPSDPRVRSLVKSGAIGKPGSRSSTVRHIVSNFGGADDPALPPIQEHLPVAAPAGDINDSGPVAGATVVPAGVGV